jgi:FtsH-binding integral membrane protein
MANAIPWIILAVLGLLLVFLAVGAYVTRKEKRKTDYRNFFNMGVIWLVIGGVLELVNVSRGEGFEFNTILMLGSIFTFAGLANKGKWGEKHTPLKRGE